MVVPVIHLTSYDPSQLDAACRAHGFVCVRDALNGELVDEAFAAAKELFALPEDVKANLARVSPETNRGYGPFGKESLNHARGVDLKESFNVRFADNDLRHCPESFKTVVPKLISAARLLAAEYARACAVALELPDDYFAQHFKTMHLCTIRFIHYPPVDESVVAARPKDNSQIRLGEHTDFGAFTFLAVESHVRGLQLKQGDTWVDVDVDGFVVNTGALMARWTNDVWRATAHRVVVPDLDTAQRHRYSCAIFFDPDADALVQGHPRFGPPKYPPINANDFLLMCLRDMSQT